MLTADQVAFYRRHRYLIVEDVLGPDILDPVRREYADLLDGLLDEWGMDMPGASFEDKLIAAYKAGHDWFQPMDISLPGDRITEETPFHAGPAVFHMLTAPRLLAVVESLIGPEITSNPIQHVRIKPPVDDLREGEIRAHVGGTDWHQDRGVAHQEADETDMITVWIAVTDATVENGCLQCIPHQGGMLPHCPQRQTAIAPGFIDTDGAIPLPVRAGGIVILHPMIPHGALDNRSSGIRWSFDLRYNVTGQPTGRAHFPDFVARSRANPDSVLRDPAKWHEMWETARRDIAHKEHIELHRWSADAPVCA